MLLSKPALVCIAALISAGAAPQAPNGGTAATTYWRLVDDYRHQNAASAQRVGALPETEIGRLVDDALNPRGEPASWTSDTLLAAAMLHTDVCLEFLVSGSTGAAFVHLNAAIRLVEAAVLRDRSLQALAGLWYRSVHTILIKMGAQVWGDALIKRSQPVIDQSEGDAAFARGLDLEIVACQEGLGVLLDGSGMRYSTPLRGAAARFEDALRRDGSLHKAALHLGRSRLLLGALDDARRWLEAATRSPLASDRYLALLYLGSMDEQEGRLGQAEARYRAATSEFPWGQSGPLALARLLSRTNREAESRAMVSRTLAQRYVVDPLWTYLARPGGEPGAFLNLIRAEIWQ
jgi:tetratricopeptide (TPR) repeat protein